MQFDPFIIPFNIGLYFILGYVVLRSLRWFMELSRPDKLRLQRGFFGRAFGQSLREIFMESLLHRSIFKANFRLGYMHMSLAFGWFLLIFFGTIEADIFGEKHLNAPYKAIFFKFFNPEHGRSGFEAAYSFLMDLILAFILTGLLLAIVKRFFSPVVGMKKTTKHTATDRIALTALWLIFPSRLIAESLTSGAYGTGSFLTGSLGNVLADFLPAGRMAYPFWWLYSIALGTFFIMLPVTRYMHIPTELFLIFMRNSGIRTGDRQGTYSEVETFSCSSCGICIDACQLNFAAGVTDIQGAYLLKNLRNGADTSRIAANCLMCGRCDSKCPVGIELSPIRMIRRRSGDAQWSYRNLYNGYLRNRQSLPQVKKELKPSFGFLRKDDPDQADVVYFAGCMTHLTPSISRAMINILEASGLSYSFLDKGGGVCCGRPLMLAGKDHEAREVINHNSGLIWKSGAKILVTSCPICFKVFRESYHLDAEVLHHSQFIKRLVDTGKIKMNFLRKKVVYHSPCDLGRGSGIYSEPKELLAHISRLEPGSFEDDNSLCCGGSLANAVIGSKGRKKIASDMAGKLTAMHPDILATACPLCKKTISNATGVRVADIAELAAEALVRKTVPGFVQAQSVSSDAPDAVSGVNSANPGNLSRVCPVN
ncbi:MAG: (Fe-S)-binding protein [Bacteroidales bacterium]|jgi:Fe-S oxidoreductase|nr:(Fe-S)-binding protein [Bacteroidales bacterium]